MVRPERHSAGSDERDRAHGAVAKRFGDTRCSRGVDLPSRTAITAVLGASGSGKTTLLRLIAGFERLDGGTISIGGRVVDDGRRRSPPEHRGVGYVAQEGALFPHLTVAGNVGFGLVAARARARGRRAARDDRAREPPRAATRTSCPAASSSAWRSPGRSRSAPSVVLLDEPFSALDASLRGDLRRDVARILPETGTTAILVTHDQDEALALADQVALLADGRCARRPQPRDLYRDPPDLGTAAAIGEANILPAHLTAGVAHCVLGSIPIRPTAGRVADGLARPVAAARAARALLHASE